MKRFLSLFILVLVCLLTVTLTGCALDSASATSDGTSKDIKETVHLGEKLAKNQPTPTDVDYSLERYNLIKRAYWVNGQREKALALPCSVTKPLGYIILITESGAVLGRFTVDGKVSSLNSWLTPDYNVDYSYSSNGGYAYYETEMPDVDGTYGTNDTGIFFFTPDGKYIEWTGTYLYSDIPFTVKDPVLSVDGE